MTRHAAFFETDGLAAFRTLFPHQAVFGLVALDHIFAGHISFFQHPGNGIRNGQHQTAILENRILAANALKLMDNFVHLDAGSQGQ